ncbi:hypothetical protein BJ878DRAFT_546036 [Calycina marina]|uniref:Uncharacterized protein n=1 Tax=Calycina marina TaxID=1763456 RepID=A0A9P7YX04_9HELO|nr:hypothetical protein BJ878DRAFT_546036 [Calycina marina]
MTREQLIITRARWRRTTPEAPNDRYEADTIKKYSQWLQERAELGRGEHRSSRKKSRKLGRNPALDKQKKHISKAIKIKRVEYGGRNQDKPIQGYWDRKVFMDEAHIDPDAQGTHFSLQEQPPFGDRYDPRNMQEKPERKDVGLHVVSWVSWNAKAENLQLYHDEEDRIIKPNRPRKHEDEAEWSHSLKEW